MTLFKFAHPDDLPCAFGFAARFLRLRGRSYSAMLRGDAATNSVCMLRHCYIGDCYQSVFLSLSLLRMDTPPRAPMAPMGPNSAPIGAMKTIGSMGSMASIGSIGSFGSMASVESAGSGRVGNPAEIWVDGARNSAKTAGIDAPPNGAMSSGFPAGNANGNTTMNQGNTIMNQGNTIMNQGNTIMNQGTGNGTPSPSHGSGSSGSSGSDSACAASVCFVWNLLPLLACSCTDACRDTM